MDNRKSNYRSISVHWTLYETLKYLALRLRPGETLSIPHAISIIAEHKQMEFICGDITIQGK